MIDSLKAGPAADANSRHERKTAAKQDGRHGHWNGSRANNERDIVGVVPIEFGHGEIITGEPKGSPAYDRAVAWWGARTKSIKAEESVSTMLTGAIKFALHELLPTVEITAVSLEFGTFPAIEVFRAMQAENWLHHHGGKQHPRTKAIKADIRRVFYPDTDDWKDLVWRQGQEVVDQALAGLSGTG